MYHCRVKRFLRWGPWMLLVGVACAVLLRPLVDATAFIIRAADVPGAPARLAAWRSAGIGAQESLSIPTRRGPVAARLYHPGASATRTVVLVPGVHRDGIDEQRLVRLAGDLVETGFRVVTVAAPDLQKFRITPDATDLIEDAILWTSTQPTLAPDGRVGVIGISFSGGLSAVAIGRDRIRDRVAFLVSFGGHGDLWRVMHYLATGEVVGDLARARQSHVVIGAADVQVHPPHDYGLAVVLLNVADQMVPSEQVPLLRDSIDRFLLASSQAMTDPPLAEQTFAAVQRDTARLPEPSRTLMTYVNTRDVAALGARLSPVVDRLQSHPGMPSVSLEHAPTTPSAPVYLLHGADDNVIPSVETVLLGEYLQGKADVHGLLSTLITHAEMNRAPTAADVWRLASFWRQVFSR